MKASAALLLACAAGLVDLVGFLGIYKVFSAHLTGTTVHLAHSIVQEHWIAALMAGIVILGFFSASIVGRSMIEAGARFRIRHVASLTLSAEGALLVLVIIVGGSAPAGALLAMLAIAMGLQTATLTKIGPLTVHTTFITGMVNKLAQLISHMLFRLYDVLARRCLPDEAGARKLRQEIGQAGLLSAVWLFYLAGAALGAWLYALLALRALSVAAGLVMLVIAEDFVRDLAIEEEREQSER